MTHNPLILGCVLPSTPALAGKREPKVLDK